MQIYDQTLVDLLRLSVFPSSRGRRLIFARKQALLHQMRAILHKNAVTKSTCCAFALDVTGHQLDQLARFGA
jgi:hypothetical protein